MATEIKAPSLPESVPDGTIATWYKKEGESVSRDELLVDIETDKVVLEVPAPADGVMGEIVARETYATGANNVDAAVSRLNSATADVIVTSTAGAFGALPQGERADRRTLGRLRRRSARAHRAAVLGEGVAHLGDGPIAEEVAVPQQQHVGLEEAQQIVRHGDLAAMARLDQRPPEDMAAGLAQGQDAGLGKRRGGAATAGATERPLVGRGVGQGRGAVELVEPLAGSQLHMVADTAGGNAADSEHSFSVDELQVDGYPRFGRKAPGVRDCSIQRRNQKLIEESSSPALRPEQDADLRTAAKALV